MERKYLVGGAVALGLGLLGGLVYAMDEPAAPGGGARPGGSGGTAPPPAPEAPGELVALFQQWQPVDAPDLPVPVLRANSFYEGGLYNYTTSGGSHEMGPTQVEGASTGGACNNPGQTWAGAHTCPFPPPGNPLTVGSSRWGAGCRALGFDPFDDVTNPVALVRVGLWNLHQRGLALAAQHGDLFPERGTAWWCGAVLCSFGPGAGWTDVALRATHATLLAYPESGRWTRFGAVVSSTDLPYTAADGTQHTFYATAHGTRGEPGYDVGNYARFQSVNRKIVKARDTFGWTG